MKNLFKHLKFLLLIKVVIATYNCTRIDSNDVCGKDTSQLIKFNCINNLMENNSDVNNNNNNNSILLNVQNEKIKIECLGSPEWMKFNYNFSSYFNEIKFINIENCHFELDTNLSNFIKLIAAKKSISLHISNKLTEIIVNKNLFKKLHSIRKLYIMNNNNLINLNNDTLNYMKKLVYINLNNNKLTEIPEMIFQNAKYLLKLFIAENFIQTLKNNTFKNLEKLMILDLHNNKIEKLDPFIFQNLKSLMILNLAENCLKTLPYQIFNTLNNLEYLNIADNQLEKLSANIFMGLKKLNLVNMKMNKIKSLPDDVWRDVINLKTLIISDNKFKKITRYVIYLFFLNLTFNFFKLLIIFLF